MENFSTKVALITAVIMQYFEGVYTGDAQKLEGAFHPQAIVSGDVNGTPYFKPVSQYIEGVKSRKSPKELGESFKMEILSVEVVGNTAVAKAKVPIFGYNYLNFLSLSLVNGKWVIVNKQLTNVTP